MQQNEADQRKVRDTELFHHILGSPVEALAGGDQGLVEVGQGTGPLLDRLQVQGIAALQVLMGNGAKTVSRRSASTRTERHGGAEDKVSGDCVAL